MNITTTFDLNPFTKVSCPTYNGFGVYNISIPNGEGIFNRKFYMMIDGKITAFKILAWAFGEYTTYHQRIAYLIQTPRETKWCFFGDTKFFPTLEDMVSGREPYNIPTTSVSSLFGGIGEWSQGRIEFKCSYYYSEYDGKVRTTATVISHIMGTKDGIYIGLKHNGNRKSSKDEVLAEMFNGVEVEDFAEPTIIEIKFEIPSTQMVTKKLVLK